MAESIDSLGADFSDYINEINRLVSSHERLRKVILTSGDALEEHIRLSNNTLQITQQQADVWGRMARNIEQARKQIQAYSTEGRKLQAFSPGRVRASALGFDRVRLSTAADFIRPKDIEEIRRNAEKASKVVQDADRRLLQAVDQVTNELVKDYDRRAREQAEAVKKQQALLKQQAQFEEEYGRYRSVRLRDRNIRRGPQPDQGTLAANALFSRQAANDEQRRNRMLVDAVNKTVDDMQKSYIQQAKNQEAAVRLHRQRIRQMVAAFREGGDAAQEHSRRVILSWRDMARVFAIQVLHTEIYRFIFALQEGVRSATEFQIRISEIRTISQENQRSFADWAFAVRNLSDQFGQPLSDTAEGVYETVSNQVAKGAEATRFMAQAMEFARVSVSSTEDAVNLLSSVLNAYQLELSEVDRVAASLFTTIDLGRVRAEDLADTYGRIAPLAANLGISFQELNAAIATITIQGIRPAETLTAINGVMRKLLKPTQEMERILSEWGVSSGEAAIATFGFNGVLRKLVEESERGNAELGELFNEIRATRGILPLTRAIENYDSVLERLNSGSLREFIEAQKIITESAGYQFRVEMQRIKNIFTEDFGGPFLGFLVGLRTRTTAAGQEVSDLAGLFRDLVRIMQVVVGTWISYRVVTIATNLPVTNLSLGLHNLALALVNVNTRALHTRVGLQLLRAAMQSLFATLSSPTFLLTAGLSAAIYLWTESRQRAAELANFHKQAEQDLLLRVQETTRKFAEEMDRRTEIQKQNIDRQYQDYFAHTADIVRLAQKAGEEQEKSYKNVAQAIKDNFELATKTARSQLSQLESDARKFLSLFEQAAAKAEEIRDGLTRKQFERELELLPDPQKIARTKTQIEDLQNRAIKALTDPLKDASDAEERLKRFNKDFEEQARLNNGLLEQFNKLQEKRKDIVERIAELEAQQDSVTVARDYQSEIAAINRELEGTRRVSDRRRQQLESEKRQLQEQARAAKEAEQARRAEGTLDDNREQLRLIDAQLKALGDRVNLAKQNADFEKQAAAALEQFAKTQQRLASDAEKQAEAERERLKHLETAFENINRFKLPEIRTEEDRANALKEFNELAEKVQELTQDEGTIRDLVRQRVELEKQAQTELLRSQIKNYQEALNKQREAEKKLIEEQNKATKDLETLQQAVPEKLQNLIAEIIKAGQKEGVYVTDPDLRDSTEGVLNAKEFLRSLQQSINTFVADPNGANQAALRAAVIELMRRITMPRVVTGLERGLVTSEVIIKPEYSPVTGELDPEKTRTLATVEKELFQAIQAYRTAHESATKVESDAAQSFRNLNIEVRNLTESIAEAERQLRALGAQPPAQGRAMGGPIVRQWGMFLSRGTDTVPAMLTPGEYVIREPMARKYKKLLDAINSGRLHYFADGGFVPRIGVPSPPAISRSESISIGSIHIHPQMTGNAAVDIITIGKGLANEIRRGRLKLN